PALFVFLRAAAALVEGVFHRADLPGPPRRYLIGDLRRYPPGVQPPDVVQRLEGGRWQLRAGVAAQLSSAAGADEPRPDLGSADSARFRRMSARTGAVAFASGAK